MFKKLMVLSLLISTIASAAWYKSLKLGTGGIPDSAAVLEIKSTTGGLLLPRMTTTQRNAIGSPPAGLTLYNSTTNTLDLFDGTSFDGFVTALSTTIFENKSFKDSNTFFIDDADGTKKVQFQISGITMGTTRVFTFPDATTTVLGTDTTQNITQKSIDANLNTITNIDNGAIKTSAAIVRSKLASGTLNHVLINDGSGVMSSEAQLGSTKGGTGASNAGTFTYGVNNITLTTSGITGVTLPTTGTLSTLAGTEILTNKIIDSDLNTITDIVNADIKVNAAIDRSKLASGTLNHVLVNDGSGVMSSAAQVAISQGGSGASTAVAAFDALSPTTTKGDIAVNDGTNNIRFGVGTDNFVLSANSGEASGFKWIESTGGGGLGINYLTGNDTDFEISIGDWDTYGGVASTPVNCIGGVTTTTFTRTISTPLRGNGSGLLTKDANSRRGEGVSVPFTIDNADKARVLIVSFEAETSTDFADNDIGIYIFDVTNTKIIETISKELKASTLPGKFSAEFQTAPDSTSYKICIHIQTTNSSAYTVKLDTIAIGPSSKISGTPSTDWRTYDLIIGGETTAPTKATTTVVDSAKWRRVGDSMEIMFVYMHTDVTGAAAGSGRYLFGLPPGFTVNESKLNGDPNNTGASNIIGVGGIVYGSLFLDAYVRYAFSTGIILQVSETATGHLAVSSTNRSIAGNSTITYSFKATVPIAGWSTNVVMSSQDDSRPIEVLANTNGGESITADVTDVTFSTEESDSHAAWSGTVFTAPFSETFFITGLIALTAGATGSIKAYIDGSLKNRLVNFTSSNSRLHFSAAIKMNAGQTLSFRFSANVTLLASTTDHWISISNKKGSQTIAATATIAANYETSIAQTLTNGVYTTIKHEDLVKDTRNTYNTSTGEYTIPESGWYSYNAKAFVSSASWAINESITIAMFVNGANKDILGEHRFTSAVTIAMFVGGSGKFNFTKGQLVTFRINQNQGVDQTTAANPIFNRMSIMREGF